MKRVLNVFIIATIILILTGCTKENKKVETTPFENPSATGKYLSGKHIAEITFEDYGKVVVELDADTAPITVTNFVNLANKKFYDKTTIHRIVKGFVIQGGDPNSKGLREEFETIKGEFASNGVENNISHVRGTISMARKTDPNSASTQFFIIHQDATYLDGDYAGFGTVIEGMEVVDKIANTIPVLDSFGSVEEDKQPVIKSVRILE